MAVGDANTTLDFNSSFDGLDLGNALAGLSKEVTSTVSQLKDQSINPIKSISERVKDGAALLKETDKTVTDKINTFKSDVLLGINSVLSDITGGKLNASDFSRVLTYQDGFKVDSDELFRIASKGLGFNASNIDGLKRELAGSFMDELSDMTLGLSDGLFYYDGTKFVVGDNWSYGEGNILLQYLMKQSDAFNSIINVAGMNSALNTMLMESARQGFRDSFSSFKDKYVFESDYEAALMRSIEILLTNGDLLSLQEVLKLLGESNHANIKAKYPKFAETILSTYRFSRTVEPEDYPELKKILLEIITSVEGKKWYLIYSEVLQKDVLNASVVTRASKDSKTLLETEPDLAALLCLTGVFKEEPAFDVFLRQFPNTVVLK